MRRNACALQVFTSPNSVSVSVSVNRVLKTFNIYKWLIDTVLLALIVSQSVCLTECLLSVENVKT